MSTVLNDEAIARARQSLRAGQPDRAEQILFTNAQQTHLAARDYDEILRTLADALTQLGKLRAAGTVLLYLREPARMAQLVTSEPRDLARAAQLDRKHALAAQHFRAARWPACARGDPVRGGRAVPRGARALGGGRRGSAAARGPVHRRARELQPRARAREAPRPGGRASLSGARDAAPRRGRGHARSEGDARARVRLLSGAAHARRRDRELREPRGGLPQLHPDPPRGSPEVLRAPVLRGLHLARGAGGRAPRGRDDPA